MKQARFWLPSKNFKLCGKKKKKQMEMPHTKEYKQEISKSPLTLTLCDICLQEGICDYGIILNPSFITKVSNSYVKQIIYNISHNWSHMEVYLKTTVFQNRVQTNSVTNYTSLTFSSLPTSLISSSNTLLLPSGLKQSLCGSTFLACKFIFYIC